MRLRSLLKILVFLILPSAAFLVVLKLRLLPLGDGTTLEGIPLEQIGLAAFWISLALLLVNVVTLFLVHLVSRRPDRPAMPALLRDLIRYGLFIIFVAIILREIFGEKVNPLIGALGIGGVVLGFALQETLSNFFAGLALLAEQPFAVGDWVRIGDRPEGIVEHITWRATKIRTRDNDYVILPNSMVAKEVVTNFRLPTQLHAVRLQIGTSYDDPPDKVKRTLLSVIDSVPGILKTPPPIIYLKSYADFSINYEVKCFIEDYDRRPVTEDQAMSRIWYAFKRAGIEIPFPIRTVFMHQIPPEARVHKGNVDVEAALQAVEIFEPLSAEERKRLSEKTTIVYFGTGEPVVRQGDAGAAMYVIISGSAKVSVRTEDGSERQVASLEAGQFFGEMSLLTGDPRTASVYAQEWLVLGEVSKDALLPLIAANPSVAEKIAELVTLRKQGLDRAHAEAALDGARRAEVKAASTNLLGRIRGFFGL